MEAVHGKDYIIPIAMKIYIALEDQQKDSEGLGEEACTSIWMIWKQILLNIRLIGIGYFQ